MFQRIQIIETANVTITNEDLGNGMAAAALHHFGTFLALLVDWHLGPPHALCVQQVTGSNAERARRGGVHHNGLMIHGTVS
jgi:hypothetical protein